MAETMHLSEVMRYIFCKQDMYILLRSSWIQWLLYSVMSDSRYHRAVTSCAPHLIFLELSIMSISPCEVFYAGPSPYIWLQGKIEIVLYNGIDNPWYIINICSCQWNLLALLILCIYLVLLASCYSVTYQ